MNWKQTGFVCSYENCLYLPAASFVLMSNTDLPLARTRWALLVWQTFTSPHPSSQHVIYRKLPKPESVSWVQFDKRRGVPHTLHPLSSWFASKLSSTMRLPVTGNSQTADSFGPLPLSLNRFLPRHKRFVLTLSDIFWKRPFLCLARFPALIKVAMLSVLLITHARLRHFCDVVRSTGCAVQYWGITLKVKWTEISKFFSEVNFYWIL